jgi:hypothetical protein
MTGWVFCEALVGHSFYVILLTMVFYNVYLAAVKELNYSIPRSWALSIRKSHSLIELGYNINPCLH